MADQAFCIFAGSSIGPGCDVTGLEEQPGAGDHPGNRPVRRHPAMVIRGKRLQG